VSDRPRGVVDRIGVLRPLRLRDFRLLWIGTTVSFTGDGFYYVVMPLQAYALTGKASTIAYVGAAWATPQVILSLASGALSDRIDRRRLLIAGDLIRLGAITTIGALSIAGSLTVVSLVALVAVYGAGQAVFGPSFEAITPSIVPVDLLVEANSMTQFVRPATMMLIGPLLGGVIAGALGLGWAFVIDGLTFAWSALMIFLMHVRTETKGDTSVGAVWSEIKEGLRYVRGRRWLLIAMFGATLSLLLVWGPWEALVPFVVKTQLTEPGGSAEANLSLIIAAGGVGALLAAFTMGQRAELPRKPILWLYLSFSLAMFMTAGFGVATTTWHGMIVAFISEGAIGVLIIIWFTLLQRLVPTQLLGRVTALDWMISTAGVPISFLIVGPLADALGVDTVLIGAGVVGGIVSLALLFVPGARDPERDGSLERLTEDRAGGETPSLGEPAPSAD
jgi:MFS family permease